MKNKKLSRRIISLLFCMAFTLSPAVSPAYIAAENSAPEIKNIIYMIPDGGGYALYDLANLVKETYGGLNKTKFPYISYSEPSSMVLKDYLIGTRHSLSYTNGIIDSAASGTTLATGIKPYNGYLGITPDKKPVANLLEAAQSKGMSTGLVTTDSWTGATPAAFSTHVADRYESLGDLYKQIENKNIDVVLGADFSSVADYGASTQDAVDRGYNVIDTEEELSQVGSNEKIWGNLGKGGMPGEYYLSSTQPTLAEMTQAAITSLSGNEDGFFLMVESSNVDGGGHGNNALLTTSEYIAFDEAFRVALDFAKDRDDTIIIATPDHDTGGLVLKDDMTAEVNQIYNGEIPSSFTWESTNHTTRDIPVWLYAPEGIDVVEGLNPVPGDNADTRANYVVDIVDIAPYVAQVMNVDLQELTNELFVDVTDIGVYFDGEKKFEFASGNKYIYQNEAVYYKDGVKVDMGYKQAVYLNDRFYVPAEMVEDDDWNYTGEKLNGIPGSGTKEDPYLIKNVYDFIEFSNNMTDGETYDGKYFSQTADIDLSLYPDEYNGMTPNATFGGIYEGNAHTINVSISNPSGTVIFPRVTGTITNLGTSGTIKTKGATSAGIARTLAPTGKLINCYSTADITAKRAGGLVYNHYGTIINSYFGGTMSADGYNAAALKHGNGKFENCYYNAAYPQRPYSGTNAMVLDDMKLSLAATLNSNRSAAAESAGVEAKAIAYWAQDDNGLPYQYIPTPTVTSVVVTPQSVTLAKGESVQLSAEITGEYEPSQEVSWILEPESTCGSTVSSDGYLTISETETNTSFTILAKSKADGSKVGICRVTITE